ncbi:MAG: DNA translocase FtsK, partial [Polyangiaceae bacterium]|nr:DNA translocase FtsK [Polyangiaceae bacterium]
LMRSLFSTVGSYLIGTTIIALVLIARASFSFISVAKRAGETTEVAARRGADGVRALTDAWNMARAIEKKRAGHTNTPIPIRTDRCDEAIFAAIDQDVAQATREATTRADREAREQLTPPPMALTPTPSPVGTASPQPPDVQVRATTHAPLAGAEEEELNTAVLLQAETDCAPDVSAPVDPATPSPAANPSATQPRRRPKADNPKIVDTSAATEVEKVQRPTPPIHASNAYQLPPFDLLEHGDNEKLVIDEELQAHLSENAQSLISTLGHYGVRGQIREIQPGPTVTTYEMEPEAGIKVSKIASLADDLAMNLGCQVRIVAPIPGKKRVGFEVPNRTRRSVNLRDLIEDRRFQEMKAPLPVVLGRDIVGKPFYADLASMPHVLVAGATGAGKSVGLNVMLASLLYRRSPEDMRLLMVDPKVVELQSFDRIPHMLLPVVTDMRQASTALKWAVDEMERRYQLLANAGTKNIKTYNAWVGRVHRGEVRGYSQPKPTITTAQDGSVVEFGPEREPPKLPTPLPYIVIVVDEFADLMMQQGKEVEASIARLAQKARAAGMHVILATQRPSVDVITGMIKANFPTRVAFKVTQRTDSRTILDEQGAEHLLGRGDMLVKLNGMNETRRVQCPFVSEDEVERLTDFLRKQGDPEYDESILQPRDDDAQTGAHDDAEQDPKYDEAVQIVAETRRCSTSWLQRKLGIGYNRAAKIVEIMEKSGLVGPAQGAKDREVLIDPL